MQLQYNRIRFSPKYFGYSSKRFWSILDLFARYNHMLIQFVILLLCLFWWFNFVNCLMFLILVIFNIRIGNKIIQIQNL